MRLRSFCSNLRSVADHLEKVGDAHLSTALPQEYSPHTRAERAEAGSKPLSQSLLILDLLDDLIAKAQNFRDLLRREHTQAANSLCPALQLPEEILRLIFVFSVENQLQKDVHILYVCQKWRVIALSCPELWTTIYTSDSIPKLQRALRLSSNLPLNVVFSHPAPPLREFESGLGSMQDIVNQIQTRSISKLIINYGETNPAPILRDAFGRGSVLSVLLAKSVHISSLTPRRAADVRGVRFPCHEVFSIWAWRFPILDVGQFCGSRLSIQTVETTPEFFARFLHGFSHLESIDIDHFVVIGGALHWQPELITFSSLRSLSFANTKALDTARTLDLVNTNGISALRLDSVLAFDYDDEDQSEGTLMANGLTLYEYFDQPGLFQSVTDLRITDGHKQLSLILDCVSGPDTSIPLPNLKELHVFVGYEDEPDDEAIGWLERSLKGLLSRRSAQSSEKISLHVPSCLRNIEADLAPMTNTLAWEGCPNHH